MATTLEELTVVLNANTRRLDRELARTQRNITRNFRQVESTAAKAGRTGGTGFVTAFDGATTRGLRHSTTTLTRGMAGVEKTLVGSGTRAGAGFVSGMATATTKALPRTTLAITRTLSGTEKSIGQSGARAGAGFATGVTSGATKTLARDTPTLTRPLDSAAQSARTSGARAGAGFGHQFSAAATAGVGRATTTLVAPLHASSGVFTDAGTAGGQGFTSGVGTGLSGVAGAFAPVAAIAGVAAGAVGSAMITAAGDFEFAMNGVRAVTGATGRDFAELEQMAKELGATTQYSATEAANAMEFLGMAGFDTTQVLSALPDVLNLAAAGNTDLARTADIASNVMSGFGIEAEESGRIADVLAQTMRSTNVDLGMLGESFKYAAPLAKAAGWSFEETAAAIGFLGNAGIQGSMAGTGLNNMLATLSDTSSTGGKKLKEFGVAAHDANGQVRPLTDILDDLADKGAGVADVIGIFGLEAGPKLQALLGQGSDGVRALIADLENADGAAQEMAQTRMEGFVGEMKGARSAVEGFFIAFADLGILEGATRAVNMVTGAVRSVTGWLVEHEKVIAPVIKAVSIFASVVLGLVGGLLAAKGAIAGVGAALGILGGPVAWVIAGVAALVTGLAVAWKRSDRFRAVVTAAWEGIQAAAATAKRFFDRYIWPGLVWGWEQVEKVAASVGRWFEDSLWPALIDGWREFRDAAQPHVERILRWLRNLRDGADGFRDRWGFLWEQAATRFRIFKDLVGRLAGNLVKQFGGWVDIITGVLSGDWGKAWDGAKTVARTGFDNIVAVGKAGAKLFWETLKLQFVQLPRAIADWLVEDAPVLERRLRTEWVPAFLGWVVEMDQKVKAKLAGWLRRFAVWLGKDVPAHIRQNLPKWSAAFTSWASGLWDKVKPKLAAFPGKFGAWVVAQAGEMGRRLDAWTDKVGQWASGLWDATKAKANEYGERFATWMEGFADTLPERLEAWTDKVVQWIEGFAESLPERLEAWTDRFVTWIEKFAEELPDKLIALTDRFVEWATSAPEDTATAFEEADGPGKIEEQIENDWAPRLLAAFGRALLGLALAIPGMVMRVGAALLSSFGQILKSLGEVVADAFSRLLEAGERMWMAIKDAIIAQASLLVTGMKEKVDELYDNTVGKFKELYTELVGNSIVPDMVSEIIGETGKLSGGVGGNVDSMSSSATEKAAAMQTAMVARMVAMGSQVGVALSRMSTASTSVLSGMVTALVRSLALLSTQTARLVGTLGGAFVGGFTTMATQSTRVFTTMVTTLVSVAGTLSKTLTSTFADMHRKTVTGFSQTVRGVGTAWAGLRQAVAAPVRYVISPVFNQGLRPVWNRIASKVPSLSPMSALGAPGFQAGGVVDLTEGGALAGFSVQDNRVALVRDGEGVLTPAATRGLGGKAFVDAANQAGTGASRLLAKGVDTFAGGGVVGLANSFNAKAKTDFDNKGGVVAAGQEALGGMTNLVGGRFGRGVDFPGAAGYRQMQVWQAAIMAQIKKHKDDLEIGKGVKGVVQLAEKSVGKYPEVPSGSNRNAITDWYGMIGPWCAMFISWLFHQTKQSKALKGAARTAWTGDYYTSGMKRVSQAQRRPGDVQVFGTNHVRLATEKGGMGIGGNESNNVRKYSRLGGALFRPAFARGGVIEARDFWHQDQGWEGPFPGEHTEQMREIWNGVQTYDQGGWLAPGYTLAYNNTGGPEPIGAEPIVVEIDLKGDDEDMVRRLRKQVKIKGGGNVQVALGSGRGRA